ncbi:telomerase-binding protein EST1A-like protein [Aphelenchoides avenae]|nr:telomerase-binding protein EST1A-like protein [Aphelenchus avenae]
MPDEEAPSSQQSLDTRKKRPDVQIYRPGMLRLGVDVTRQPTSSSGSDAPVEQGRHSSSQSSNKHGYHDHRQNCPTFDSHHRPREDHYSNQSERRGKRYTQQRRPDQRPNNQAPSAENLFRPPSQQSNKSQQSTRSHQPYKQTYYAGQNNRQQREDNQWERGDERRDYYPPTMPTVPSQRPRGNHRRNTSHRSVQSERPASNRRDQQTDDSDAQSVFTDTMSNFGDNELNDRSLRSQTSQSSLNSAATASDFMKPSMESLLSLDLPTIDWMEEVNKAEEEMKTFEQQKAADPTTPTATPRHGPTWRRQPQDQNQRSPRGVPSPTESRGPYGAASYKTRSPRQVLSPASSNRSLANSNIPVPQNLPMKDRIQRVNQDRYDASRNGDHGQRGQRVNKNNKQHEYRQQRPIQIIARPMGSVPQSRLNNSSGMAILNHRLPKVREGEAANSPTAKTPTTPTPPSGNSTATASPSTTPSTPRRDATDSDWAQIKKLVGEMERLCGSVTKMSDDSIVGDITGLSKKLAGLYGNYIKRNVRHAYVKATEQALFKHCFHTPVEVLRTAGNGSRQKSRHMQDALVAFIDQFMLESAHRLFLPIGDLYRYKVTAEGIQDYSQARLWYLRAAQLHPTYGRSYNQLALLAVYSNKWIDVVFFYIRALAAKHPYDSSKQTLDSAFNDVAKRAVHQKQIVLQAVDADGKLSKREDVEMDYDDRVREIWFLPDGSEKHGSRDAKTVSFEVFLQLQVEELYKSAVMHWLHVAGLLVTKIGMEHFPEYAELALGELAALLSLENTPMNALNLVQIAAALIFSVHNAALKGADQGTCSAQQFTALQMVLSLWTVLMSVVRDHLEQLVDYLETGKAPNKLLLVLPATSVICEWISTPFVHGIYRTMPTLEGVPSRFVPTEPWSVLATIANKLAPLHSEKLASICSVKSVPTSGPKVEAYLPEMVLLSSFCSVFPVDPTQLVLLPTSCKPSLDEADRERIALHARVHSILTAAEYLDGSELHCFTYDTMIQQFCAVRCTEEPSGMATPIAPSPRLLAEEQADNRSVMEVRPEYLIVDTNAFVDYLGSIQKVIESRKFSVLIPTIVVAELKGLSSTPGAEASLLPAELDDTNAHEKYVTENAKKAIAFLRKAADARMPGISTITSKGDRLPQITFAVENVASTADKQVNDDFILNSCIELSKKVVLLTDDRALRIKAMAARIPVRAVPEFMKWCGL